MTSIERKSFKDFLLLNMDQGSVATDSELLRHRDKWVPCISVQSDEAFAFYGHLYMWCSTEESETFEKDALLRHLVDEFLEPEDVLYEQNPSEFYNRMKQTDPVRLQVVVGRGEAYRKVLCSLDHFAVDQTCAADRKINQLVESSVLDLLPH